MQEKILIVDDEIDIVELLQDYFTLNGYETLTATSGEEAIRKAEKRPDLILLDIGMPGLDGLQVCAKIRNFVSCPIVFLTARIEESDKLQGFGSGGDDYIVKPFSIDELGARVAAHLRREKRKQRCSRIKFDDDLAIDYTERAVYYQNKPLNLAKKEFDIVELLSQHAGQVFDNERIYERIWGYDSEGDSTVVAEHIRRVRAKFAAAGMKPVIETVWGVGYKWVL
ncbi:MAG: response regulator transcription factor [Oscillospiraceae bacterium]